MPLASSDFIHPEDSAALENLKSIPLFTPCLKAFMNLVNEQLLFGVNMAQKIRLGPDQLPDIYRRLPPACEALQIPVPEMYLELNPFPNAYTFGDTRVFITLTSGLLECMQEDELKAVIAHECGHIACRHVLYQTMASMLARFGSSVFGLVGAVSLPVQLALFYWQRRSELSADRAAALVMQNPQPVVETMLRLAGGPKSITGGVNLDRYVEQADTYDHLLESKWDKLLQGVAVMQESHPFLSVRTREIRKWCATDHFTRLAEALRSSSSPRLCPACAQPVRSEARFCPSCGSPLGCTNASN